MPPLFSPPRSRPLLSGAFALVALAATLLPGQRAAGADGELDPTFVTDLRRPPGNQATVANPNLPLPDGRILVYGSLYTNAGGTTLVLQQGMQIDGASDPSLSVALASGATPRGATCALVQPDGKIVLGGGFDTVNGQSRSCIVRLLPDLSVDPSFVPPAITASQAVVSLVQQADGKIIITGFFTLVDGVARNRIARLNADGSLDTSFNPVFDRVGNTVVINSVDVQDDGKILVGGAFTSVNGDARANFARLNADGTTDALTVDTSGTVQVVMAESSGRLTLAGSFSSVRGVPYPQIARIAPDGSLDAAFNPAQIPNANGLRTMALQADGKLVLGGGGGANGPGPWGRLDPDGTLDSAFVNPTELRNVSGALNGLVLQADGGLLLGRTVFAGSTPDDNPLPLVRVKNAGTQSLEVTAGSVRWLRAGGVPEAREVAFQLSTDGGATWSSLGAGTRIAGGWELNGLSLPPRGQVRAFFRPVVGNSQAVLPRLVYAQAYHLAGPEIAVEQPVNRPVAFGGSRNYGNLVVGAAADRTFLVRNLGTSNLSDLTVTLSGPNAADFSLVTFPVPPVSGPSGTTDFTVRFRPSAPGTRTAALSIANNTPGRESFQIALSGTGLADGTPSILPAPAVNANPNNYTYGSVVQPDGRSVIYGDFTAAGGFTRNGLARLTTSGRVESAYNPNVGGTVRAAALQPDGRLIIGGSFGSVGGQSRSNLARLNADGTLDTSFTGGVDGQVTAVTLQPDGRVLVGGNFANANGVARTRAARFLADGTLDTSFVDPQFNNFLNGLRLLPDGRMLAHGFFTTVAGQPRLSVARLNSDGTFDPTFAPAPNSLINTLAVQPDGRILIGGAFTSVSGFPSGGLARLQADGSVDTTFASGANFFVYSIALQADGRVLAAGAFTSIGGLSRQRLARLNADGTGDPTFTADTQANTGDSAVFSVGLLPDEQILATGAYDTVNGVSAPNLTRLANTLGTATLSVPGGDVVDWQRSGTAPQAESAEFALSTDGGMSWASLGFGSPVAGGWRLSGLALPQVGQIRARAVVPGGYGNGSSGLVEQTVSFVLTPVQTWRALQGLPFDGSADYANPSGDGNVNLVRYAFNMAPNAGDLLRANSTILPPNGTAGLPFLTRDNNGRLFIEFVRRRAASNPGIAYTVEAGPSMNSLAPIDVSAAQVVVIDATWERVTVTDPVQTTERFGRVRITPTN